jgi:hypothetical protein
MMRFFMIIMCGLSIAMPASAIVSITNLSDVPQSFIVSERTNQQEIITVQPQRTWQTFSPQVTLYPVNQPDNVFRGRDFDKFYYWPNDEFGIQFRRRRHGSR